MAGKKTTVYLGQDDVVRLGVLKRALKKEYPMMRVSVSFTFRYCLYKVLESRGMANEAEAREAGVRRYGNEERVQ